MKISLFFKSYIVKACSSVFIIALILSIPTTAKAGFLSDLALAVFGGDQAQADEPSVLSSNSIILNSQTLPLLESSVNPDLKHTNDPEDIVIVQNDSFIYNEGSYVPDVKFEKSTISDQIVIYTVEPGDTLSEIAEDFGVSTNTIRWENNISGQTISVGQKLNILPVTGVKHIVKSGDTISKIADKYDADAEDIYIFNDIGKTDVLKQGSIIFVPNGIIKPVVVKPTTSTSSSTATTTSSNTKVESGYYIRPVDGRVTSPYGSRKGGFHPGVDLGGIKGVTGVKVAATGVVTKVVTGCVEGRKSCGGGYGNHIDVIHPNGTMTRYAHLSRVMVRVGDSVSQGEIIGILGNTGSSTGPHLHFEIRNSSGSSVRPPFK